MDIADMERSADGTLPAYAWPGGYPMYYLSHDGLTLCATCASKDDTSDPAIAADVHWEGPAEQCEDCGASIPSAYGDPDQVEEGESTTVDVG